MTSPHMCRILAALALAACLPPVPGHAQVPADARWQTIESTHFRVTYGPGLEHLARRAAASAERGHAALRLLVAEAPRGTIDIVVTDNVDFSNGFAMPFPSNRIVIYAKPPVDVLELQYTDDWIDMVVVHELAHVFHLDVAGPFGRALRSVFGRVPFGWPFFPAVGTPRWGIEGLATAIESTLTDFGRVHGSYHDMVVRTAVLEGRLDPFDRLDAGIPLWPGTARVYIYGSLFTDYLTRTYGPDAIARMVQRTAGAIVPPMLWFGQVGTAAFGSTFREAYAAWQRELENEYARLATDLDRVGLTRGQPLTGHGAYALYPRFSPDGSAIAYAANDWRSTPRVRAIDAATGRQLWSRRANGLAASAWLPDGGVVSADIDFVDLFRIFSDLHVLGGTTPGRLTRGERLQDPATSRDGRRIVAVQNRDGTNRLVIMDRTTGSLRAVTDFDEHVHWTLPRFAPDGARIAAGRWRTGGEFEIVVLDTLGRPLIEVTRSAGISDAPAWSPDGHWLLFWSDRTGIPNLYAAEIGQMGGDAAGGAPDVSPLRPRIRQITNVLTGAFHPEVSPDGRWIVYAAYGHDGFRLERMAFDPATWREPMPAQPAGAHVAHRPVVARPGADAFAQAIRSAVAAADTTAGPARRYAPARHLRPYGWVPLLEAGGVHDDFVGFWTYGADLVDRHRWELGASVSVGSGQTQGHARYTFAGLPATRLAHPTVGVGVIRTWDIAFEDPVEQQYIDEREDRAEIVLGLSRTRWRARTGLTLAGELVHRSRHLVGFPAELRLRDPADDLYGARASLGFANFVMPPWAISRENGVALQAAVRERRDRSPTSFTNDQGALITFDGSYREFTTWNAGYLALPLPGFARHVLALRSSGLFREGPGAGTSGIGGASGAPVGVTLPGISGDIGGTGRLLPVRGFHANARRGTRAWTASAEYRLPLAVLATSLAPLPVFADRLSAAAFVDAGHAWCDPAQGFAATACAFTDARARPLLAAGPELTTLLSVYGITLPVRVGVGFPLQGTDRRTPVWHLLLSGGF